MDIPNIISKILALLFSLFTTRGKDLIIQMIYICGRSWFYPSYLQNAAAAIGREGDFQRDFFVHNAQRIAEEPLHWLAWIPTKSIVCITYIA